MEEKTSSAAKEVQLSRTLKKPLFKGWWSFTFLLNCFDKIFSHSPLHLTLNLVRYNLQLIIAQTFLAPHYDLLIHFTLSLPIWSGRKKKKKKVYLTFDLFEVGHEVIRATENQTPTSATNRDRNGCMQLRIELVFFFPPLGKIQVFFRVGKCLE